VVLVTSGAGPTNVSSWKTRSYARLPAIGSPSASRIHCETNAPRFFGPPTMGSDSVLLLSSWFMNSVLVPLPFGCAPSPSGMPTMRYCCPGAPPSSGTLSSALKSGVIVYSSPTGSA
jgi:hypothetical protein